MKRFFQRPVLSLALYFNTSILPPTIGFDMAFTDSIKVTPILTAAASDLEMRDIAISLQDTGQDHTLAAKPDSNPSDTMPTPTKAPVPTAIPAQPIPAPSELESWFTTYGEAFRVNPNVLKVIANCESHYNPNAQSGPYGGMYQYMASTWSSTRRAMGLDPDPALRFNAEEAIKTTAWKISVDGIGAWPACSKKALSLYGSPLLPAS